MKYNYSPENKITLQEKRIIDVKAGQIFRMNGHPYPFLRILTDCRSLGTFDVINLHTHQLRSFNDNSIVNEICDGNVEMKVVYRSERLNP